MAVTADDIINVIMTPMRQDLESAGITAKYLAQKLKRELNAKTTKLFQHEGKITDERDFIDWTTRQKARMDAHALLGHYPPAKHELSGPDGGPIDFNDIPTQERETLLAALRMARKVLIQDTNDAASSPKTNKDGQ